MQIKIIQCLHNKNDPHVLQAIWKGQQVLLKIGKLVPHYERLIPPFANQLKKTKFLSYVNNNKKHKISDGQEY